MYMVIVTAAPEQKKVTVTVAAIRVEKKREKKSEITGEIISPSPIDVPTYLVIFRKMKRFITPEKRSAFSSSKLQNWPYSAINISLITQPTKSLGISYMLARILISVCLDAFKINSLTIAKIDA
ncbi:hypothetical protein ACO02O_03052 [Dirofilaria immitis]